MDACMGYYGRVEIFNPDMSGNKHNVDYDTRIFYYNNIEYKVTYSVKVPLS